MATGSGKTFTAITAIYRLLKYGEAKRILFLVDTKNLGEQAEQEFMSFTPTDDNRKFTVRRQMKVDT
jgi:type I restriction enzyme R subunit